MIEVYTPAELALAHEYYAVRPLSTTSTIRQAVDHLTTLVDRAREERSVLTANLAAQAADRDDEEGV